MKNSFFYKLLFFILFVFAVNLANAQTVYVTEKGKKYHKKNCSVVPEGKRGISLAEAKKQGYEPCASCKPEATVVTDEKKAATKNEKKK
jgi:hypothetical protein